MDIDFVVRTPENEERCKKIYEIIKRYEYRDWMKIVKIMDYLYSAIGYIPLEEYEKYPSSLSQIIHNECFNYSKKSSINHKD